MRRLVSCSKKKKKNYLQFLTVSKPLEILWAWRWVAGCTWCPFKAIYGHIFCGVSDLYIASLIYWQFCSNFVCIDVWHFLLKSRKSYGKILLANNINLIFFCFITCNTMEIMISKWNMMDVSDKITKVLQPPNMFQVCNCRAFSGGATIIWAPAAYFLS